MNVYRDTGLLELVLNIDSGVFFAKFTITSGIDVRGEYNDSIFQGDTDKENE